MTTAPFPAGPLGADRVVAFDLETTGLDPRRDAIIEAGVVRLEAGEVQSIHAQLYDPGVPIPELITQITGISTEDCQGQPGLSRELPKLLSWMEGDWLVAQNASFDLGFMKAACKRMGIACELESRLVDTLELARLALPWLSSHKLEALAGHFRIPLLQAHRAGDDAAATGRLFFQLTDLLVQMDERAFTRALRLTQGVRDGLHRFLQKLSVYREAHPPGYAPKPVVPKAVLGGSAPLGQAPPNLPEHPWDCLTPGGAFANRWPNYEPRQPQIEMAQAVDQAFRQDGFLVAEAGTGVGKTVAYLLPALYWALAEQGRVVVATHTKTLQDQIFAKDLPGLREVLGGGFLAVLLKGRRNYLCQRQLELLIHHADTRLNPRQRRQLLPLLLWAEESETGDIEENAGFAFERNLDLWSQIHSDGRHCLGPLCEYHPTCHYQRIRKAAKAAHVVLVNHALLFADIVTGHGVLGEYESLIVDEAHQLERAATDSLALTLSEWGLVELTDHLLGATTRQAGLVGEIDAWTRSKGLEATRQLDYHRLLETLSETGEELKTTGRDFFLALKRLPALKGLTALDKVRIRDRAAFFGPLSTEIGDLGRGLDAVYDLAVELSSRLDGDADLADPDGLDLARRMEGLVQETMGFRERLVQVVDGMGEEDICWAEAIRGPDGDAVAVRSVPLDIAKLLANQLYPGVERCVMTSATLSIGGRFNYALNRLGLILMDPDRVTTRLFGSPFDYASQVRLLVPTYMVSPKSPQFTAATAALLIRVFETVSRGAMVLFTSHRMLREVYAVVKPILSAEGVTLLGQSLDGSRSQLLRRFREEHGSVLFGTASFWEGVDVPGEALELLVLTKIPFDVPSEPVVEARTEAVEARTGSGFMNFAVPEAIVKVRQGFGRLIRSGQDRGAVLLLDPRVAQTQYGRFFLDALPVQAMRCNSEATLLEGLANWFEKQ